MCLPSCPTYEETKLERHGPRGRIALLRAVADGELEVTKALGEEMYYCLGCLACTTACPAGVDYAALFETARAEVEDARVLATPTRSAVRWFALRLVFTRPRLLRALGRGLRWWQASGWAERARRAGLMNLLPENLRRLEPQAPVMRARFSHELIAPVERPERVQRRVAVLTGCVQDLAYSEVNRATVDVLKANGCEVLTPPVQPCCGSLHAHNGDVRTARELARRQLDLIDPGAVDAIISNAGGCGSHLRHYDRLLADDPVYAARAAEWSRKVRDVAEYLVEIGFRLPRGGAGASGEGGNLAVTYHESCHLCHGQGVSRQPRELLRAIPGVELRECAEATTCCGSAGIYSLTQPETADRLRERKLWHLRATGAAVVATGNPGCQLQIENGYRAAGEQGPEVVHPVVLLARAYREESGEVRSV
ncbi:MAG: heterodisulfide reductase-related iron-sulfur binding cluster [Opitutaceae bacterium]|nr:heterodisulfide reductase-related iron-sulfur binding cluster [Opitutaceae bacterium]